MTTLGAGGETTSTVYIAGCYFKRGDHQGCKTERDMCKNNQAWKSCHLPCPDRKCLLFSNML